MYDIAPWLGETNTLLVLAIVIVIVGLITVFWMMARRQKSKVQVADELNVGNLSLELKTVTANWYLLGINLGLQMHKLEKIERDYRGSCDEQMLHMLDLWLRRAPTASWENVANALQQMGENKVAENIRQKYFRRRSTLS